MTMKASPKRRQHVRSAKVIIAPSEGQPLALVRITQDGEPAHYWLGALPSDFGRAYRLERQGLEGESVYDVLLGDGIDSFDICTCPGHTYGGYCKHVDCCRALLAAGKLPDDPRLAAYKPAGHDHGIPF